MDKTCFRKRLSLCNIVPPEVIVMAERERIPNETATETEGRTQDTYRRIVVCNGDQLNTAKIGLIPTQLLLCFLNQILPHLFVRSAQAGKMSTTRCTCNCHVPATDAGAWIVDAFMPVTPNRRHLWQQCIPLWVCSELPFG